MIEIEREQGDTALKIVSPQENKIVIELTNADMTELDITYEEMDYGNIETRRVIWTVLDRARHALSRDIDPSGKMLIETVPAPDGGCVLYITVLQVQTHALGCRSFLRIHKERTRFTYAFDSLGDLTACAMRLREDAAEPCKSSLFLLDGQYRLSICSELPPRRVKALLAEYGTPCADGAMPDAFLREHGKLLAEDDAIEKLTIGL